MDENWGYPHDLGNLWKPPHGYISNYFSWLLSPWNRGESHTENEPFWASKICLYFTRTPTTPIFFPLVIIIIFPGENNLLPGHFFQLPGHSMPIFIKFLDTTKWSQMMHLLFSRSTSSRGVATDRFSTEPSDDLAARHFDPGCPYGPKIYISETIPNEWP